MLIITAKTSFKGYFQFVATLTGLISILSCGFIIGWSSPTLPKLLPADSEIPTTNSEGSWLATINTVGSSLGGILTAYVSNKIGRKYTLILSSFISLIGWMTIAFAQSIATLMCGRFICGFVEGIAILTMSMYVGEIAHPNVRGLLCSLLSLAVGIGVLIMNIVGSYLTIKNAALVCSSVSILHILTFWWMPESPYFLLMTQQQEKARRSLEILRGVSDVDVELYRIRDAVVEQKKHRGNFLDLICVKSNRKALVICFVYFASTIFCGTIAISNYLQIVFQEADAPLSSVTSCNIYIAINTLASLVFCVLVDRYGRRPLLIISSIGSCFAIAAEGLYYFLKNTNSVDLSNLSYLPVILLFVYVILISLGLINLSFIIPAELFPMNVKSFAFCIINIFSCACFILVSKFFQITKDSYGIHVPFICFSGSCVILLLIAIFVLPETKKKTLEEIQNYLNNSDNDSKTSYCSSL